MPGPVTNLLDGDRACFATLLADKPYRADQVFQWVFQKGARSIDAMTNLPLGLRESLARTAEIVYPDCITRQVSCDGTEKLAYRLNDGHVIESVLIPEEEHWTVCISTQAGCAMGCTFCCTAGMGFRRNLSHAEIVAQVLYPLQAFPDRRISNVVVMGMGEPLLNYAALLQAIRTLSDPLGPKISRRHITVSTCGIVPGIVRLGQDIEVGLAISLNATTDETRSLIMPVNRRYPLETLMQTLRDYPLPKRRRITFEYVLLDGINDSRDDARRLVKLLHGLRAKVNLIPFNPWPGSPYGAPQPAAVEGFEHELRDRHITVMRRREKGQDILAACGQLAGGKRYEQ